MADTPEPIIPPAAPRSRLRPTGAFTWWLIASGMLVAVGWIKNINLVLLLAYLLIALIGVNAYSSWRIVQRIQAKRRKSPPAFARESVPISVEVFNNSTSSAIVKVRESSGLSPLAWFMPLLPAQARVPLSAMVTFPQRGIQPLPTLEAISEYPFGIVRWTHEICPADTATVLPALGGINLEHLRQWLLKSGTGEARMPRSSPRHAPADGDVRGLRPYRVGDSPRDVHWRSSARRQQLLVREYEQIAPIDLTIIVDPWVPSLPCDGNAQLRLEWALSVAISAAWAWVHSDISGKITLIVAGEIPILRTGPGTPGFVRNGFAPLAELKGSPNIPPLPQAAAQKTRRTIRWVVSTRPRSPIAQGIRKMGVAVAVTDPTLRPFWFTPPIGLEVRSRQ